MRHKGRLYISSSSLAQWYALVRDAEKASGYLLTEELENYLVLLLQRFTDKPEVTSGVMALQYLGGKLASGTKQQRQLRDVGDQCLLFSGLFPEQAERRHVPVSYFVEIGQHAYHILSLLSQSSFAELFHSLDQHFVCLMDTLQSMRELAGEEFGISPLQAEELWRSTGSEHALKVLHRYTEGWLVLGQAPNKLH